MWIREPAKDKRFARGDDYAGDAWRNDVTGEIRYTAVGYQLRLDNLDESGPAPIPKD